ncbi:MAG: penicillin-binding protein activator [Xanthomonadales bacterium]|nr:penicillin-binding protein activator [Xanthomonadales bacterium]
MQIPIRPLLPLLLAALLAACTGMPSRRADLPSEMDAQTLFLQGDFGAAADAWLQLARANRGQRARYRLRAAEAYREEGDSAAMQALVGEIDRRKLPSEDLFRLDLMEAELALGRQDAAAALALLATPEGSLPPEYAPRYHELRARAYAVQGAPLDAVAERVALDALLAEGADQEANAEQIRQLVATLSEADLRTRLREADRDDPLYPWLLAGARAQAQARGAGGSYAAEIAATRPLEAAEPAIVLQQVERATYGRVALLLPAQGPLAAASAAVREGVFAAYFADPNPRPALKVYDSGSTPEEALAAYQQALADGAERVLGPISREAVTALFQGQVERVPTLALNYADAPALPPPGSLQFALLPEEEAASAADRMIHRGLRRALVLVPRDDVGQRAAAAFGERLRAQGGVVAGQAEYDPAAADQSLEIRRLVGIEQSQARLQFLRGLLGTDVRMDPTPRADVDALFLFARNAQARVLLPQLKASSATRFPILATSAIYGGSNSAADGELDGVEFCEVPWLLGASNEPSIPTRAQMVALKTASGPAARLFAFGIDAYRLLPHLEWLERNPGRPVIGATGALGADPNGRIRREPGWARYTGASPRPVD